LVIGHAGNRRFVWVVVNFLFTALDKEMLFRRGHGTWINLEFINDPFEKGLVNGAGVR
jgi:hypothetical protein